MITTTTLQFLEDLKENNYRDCHTHYLKANNKRMKYMMIKTMLIAFYLLISNNMSSQTNIKNLRPKDSSHTSFYRDGQIKKFYYKNRINITGRFEGAYIKMDSVCDKTNQSQNIVSTVFEDNNSNVEIFHYKDSVSILYENNFKLPIYHGLKKIKILLHNCNNTGLLLEYNDKSLVERFLAHRLAKEKYQNEKYYSDLNFNSISLEKKFEFQLPENVYLISEFYKNNYFKSIRYIRQDINDTFLINFYYNNIPSEHGHIIHPKGRVGKWYSYHKNGKLKSEGEYSGSKFKFDPKIREYTEYDMDKTGKWMYYTIDGCAEKEEFWEEGKLIRTQKF